MEKLEKQTCRALTGDVTSHGRRARRPRRPPAPPVVGLVIDRRMRLDSLVQTLTYCQPKLVLTMGSTFVDTLNVWHEGLPEFDHEAIGAKYKEVKRERMTEAESNV
jgi:hypothetical protein